MISPQEPEGVGMVMAPLLVATSGFPLAAFQVSKVSWE